MVISAYSGHPYIPGIGVDTRLVLVPSLQLRSVVIGRAQQLGQGIDELVNYGQTVPCWSYAFVWQNHL